MFLDGAKFKAVADDIFSVSKIMIFVFVHVENIVGKEKMLVTWATSPFPSIFSKIFFLRVVKSWDFVVKS